MTLSTAWLDELRARTVLSAVISPTVKLIRAGREWKACCPFHNEKTPSFTVNDDKGFYHCFGCGAHGDAIRFLTDQRGMMFMDAVKELAAKAGMEVPAPDPKAKERADRAASLTDVMGAVQKYYAEQLQGLAGAEAREYLKRRGIDQVQVARFGIGLAPDSRTALKRALAHLGEEALVETGMLIRPEEGGESYDRFRGRLMIPIRDPRGRVIAFGGRILGPGEPKYLNSPDTPLFDKGRTLYNLDLAGPASRTAKRLIVVEGYMDVIGLDRAGIAEVVAPNGTAVTEAQLERMWRLDPSPILCFDGDSAGRKAAIRAATRAMPHIGPERTLRFVELPAGPGPRRCGPRGRQGSVRGSARQARAARRAAVAARGGEMPLTTPEARAGLRQRLVDHAGEHRRPRAAPALPRPVAAALRDRDRAPTRSAAASSRATNGRSKAGRWTPPTRRSATAPGPSPPSGIDAPTARALILGFTNFPEALPAHCEQLASLPIADRGTARLRDELVEAAFSGAALDHDGLATILGTQTERRAERPLAPWAFPSPAATAIRTAPGAISPPQSRSSRRPRKWRRPWWTQPNASSGI